MKSFQLRRDSIMIEDVSYMPNFPIKKKQNKTKTKYGQKPQSTRIGARTK